MDINTLRQQNLGYKTANIDGVLFLINDGCDELGYHYMNDIKHDCNILKKVIIERYMKYNNYFFVVIPDKSVLLKEYLKERLIPQQGVCARPHINAIKDLGCVIDTYDMIIKTCKEHNKLCYLPGDTHSSHLSIYAYYLAVINKLNLIYSLNTSPVEIQIKDQHIGIYGDLTTELNNGTRDLSSLKGATIPLINLSVEPAFTRFQIIDVTKKDFLDDPTNRLDYTETQIQGSYWLGEGVKFHADCFVNDGATNDLTVLYFVDSNTATNPFVKRCFASHFKRNYFVKDAFLTSIVDVIKPNIIVEQTMERFLNLYRMEYLMR